MQLRGMGKGWLALPARRGRGGGLKGLRAESSSEDGATTATEAKANAVNDVILDSTALPENFCIIEGASENKVCDFADFSQDELLNNIESRKNKIFIMLEELRRLRVQLQLKKRGPEVRRCRA